MHGLFSPISSVAAANTDCQTRATAAGLPGSYQAWFALTAGVDDPATTFTQATGRYMTPDGTVIATNGTAFRSGSDIIITSTVSPGQPRAAPTAASSASTPIPTTIGHKPAPTSAATPPTPSSASSSEFYPGHHT